jgi:hypothetical protein
MYGGEHVFVNADRIAYVVDGPSGGTTVSFSGDEDDVLVLEESFLDVGEQLKRIERYRELVQGAR